MDMTRCPKCSTYHYGNDPCPNEELLVAADGFGCSAGLLLCTQEQLDEAVSQGVREGHLKMEE